MTFENRTLADAGNGAAFDQSAVEHRGSYWKTLFAAGIVVICSTLAALGVAALAARQQLIPHAAGWTLASLGLIALMAAMVGGLLVVFGSVIALRRDALETAGNPYSVAGPREAPQSWRSRTLRALIALIDRRPGALHLRPGDRVVVRDLDEILATLDENGALDGLPFMPEMAAFCGKPATVFRRVDKINDWIHREGLKRVLDVVQLDDARCTGEAHGGCESSCRLRWKEAWLRGASDTNRVDEPAPVSVPVHLYQLARRPSTDGVAVYRCQATDLAVGAASIASWDFRHVIRDLATGNVRFRPLLSGIALACFNWVQRKRSGVVFPNLVLPAVAESSATPLDLRPGDRVRVRSKEQIAKTLNQRSRHRGLYFDPEMIRFCGGEYTVRRVVGRAIAERTGQLKASSLPSILLEGVRNTGEYVWFNPEDEYIFWHEVWLERPPLNDDVSPSRAATLPTWGPGLRRRARSGRT